MSKVFMEEVEKNSSGRLKIEFYEQGAIIGINELFDGVSKGTVEMGFGSALFEMGVLPEAEVEWGLPGSFDRYQDYWDFWFTYKDGTAVKILDAAYKERGIHYLTMDPAIMGIYTKFSIKRLDDLKGKKISAGGAAAWLMEKIGAKPVNIPSAELYVALQRGTIDAAVQINYLSITHKIAEVTTHFVEKPSSSLGTANLYVNLNAFSKLPADLQKVVEEAAKKGGMAFLKQVDSYGNECLEKANKDNGLVRVTLPDEDGKTLIATATPYWDQVAAKAPRNAELVNLIKQFLKEKK